MKTLFLIFFLLFLSFNAVAEKRELINKSIICKEIYKDFQSMYGFKFIDEKNVQILIKNSDTVGFVTDNILKYNTTKEIIYIIGLDDNSLINYGFNIFRDSLKVWAFNVTALEPFFNSNQCEVYYDTPRDFKSFFKSIFINNTKSPNTIKKI